MSQKQILFDKLSECFDLYKEDDWNYSDEIDEIEAEEIFDLLNNFKNKVINYREQIKKIETLFNEVFSESDLCSF